MVGFKIFGQHSLAPAARTSVSPATALLLLFAMATSANAQTAFGPPVTRNERPDYYTFDSRVLLNGVWKYHAGVDYFCSDLRVMAANAGVVYAVIPDGPNAAGFGNTVLVRHTLWNGTRVYSQYSHLASFKPGLAVGQLVLRGDLLGTMGMTGNSKGIVHLHFEMKVQGVLGNPLGVGLVPAQSCWGYVPINAGNMCVATAAAYGYYSPASWYGNGNGICWAGLGQGLR